MRRTPGARILCWFSLQSRRWLVRHLKQSVQKFLTNAHFLFRRHVGQRSGSSRCMHTLWCLLVSAGVPRMRLCSSFFVVQHFDLSVGLLFIDADLVFLRTCLFRRLVRNFSFELSFRRLKFETTSSAVRVGIRTGFRVCGRTGVLVSGCLFLCSCSFAYACRPWVPPCLPWVPACLPAFARLPLPALGACLPASDAYLPASCACRPASGACEMNETLNQVPRGYGNDVPVDCETNLSSSTVRGGLSAHSASRASSRAPRDTLSCRT